MSYEEQKNETEILSTDEQKVREMCCSLKRVEAPKDFEFKLKARIADSKASDFRPRFGFAFRYALPAFAVILVLGLLAYNGGLWSSRSNDIAIGGTLPSQSPDLPKNTTVSNFTPPEKTETPNKDVVPSNSDLPKIPENRQIQIAEATPQSPKKNFREDKKNQGGGSKDSGLGIEKTPEFNPQGLNQKTPLQELPNNEKIEPMPVKDALSIIGINAAFEKGKWTVKSLSANGLAESSGVKENDIIEAIDDQPLSTETINGKTFKGNTIIVTRNGTKSQIKLRNK